MFYLRPKKLDIIGSKTSLEVYVHAEMAKEAGIMEGDLLDLTFVGYESGAVAVLSDTIVAKREIGIPASLWREVRISVEDPVAVEVQGQAQSIKYIRKKILGGKLNYEEIFEIMNDIAKRRLSPVEMTYFASASYSPGFDNEEMVMLTKAMADTGTKLDFRHINPIVVDKHSIGGMPSKGVTPILVSLMAAMGFVIPNTSTRAITAPAGTSDILEVVMPVALTKDQIVATVEKARGCLVWGGGVDLAPADDILIQIERPLHVESYDKFIISIIAKKIAAGITHVVIDLPYGEGAKVPMKDIDIVTGHFEEIFAKFGIKVFVYKREAKGPDGNGIGPLLEIKDVLLVLERSELRPRGLENLTLDMAARLVELTGKYTYRGAFEVLLETLESGKALNKFWEIAYAQGATQSVKADELIPGEYTFEVKSTKDGVVKRFDNHSIVMLTKALGAPFVKKAGIYLHSYIGDRVTKNIPVATLYADSSNRLELAKRVLSDVGDSWVIV